MIKIICIKSVKHPISKKAVKERVMYFTDSDSFYTKEIINIFIGQKETDYLAPFFKEDFITLEQFREQQINKILNDD